MSQTMSSMRQDYATGYGQPGPKLPSAILNEVQHAEQVEQRLSRLVSRIRRASPQAVRSGHNWQGGGQDTPSIEQCLEQLNQSHSTCCKLLDEIEQFI